MRIAISGPQCTGKTTLLTRIGDELENNEREIKGSPIVVIKEVVRTLKTARGGKLSINRNADVDSQQAILIAHHKNALRNPNMVTDRCSWDAFVYATYNYLKGDFTYFEWQVFEEMFLDTIYLYDTIFYLPIGIIPMIGDGVRDEDLKFQQEIDGLFRTIARKYKLKVREMKESDIDARACEVVLVACMDAVDNLVGK